MLESTDGEKIIVEGILGTNKGIVDLMGRAAVVRARAMDIQVGGNAEMYKRAHEQLLQTALSFYGGGADADVALPNACFLTALSHHIEVVTASNMKRQGKGDDEVNALISGHQPQEAEIVNRLSDAIVNSSEKARRLYLAFRTQMDPHAHVVFRKLSII